MEACVNRTSSSSTNVMRQDGEADFYLRGQALISKVDVWCFRSSIFGLQSDVKA